MMRLGNLVVAFALLALLALSLSPRVAAEETAPDRPLNPVEKRFQGNWDGFEPVREESRWTLHFEGRSFRAVGPDQWYEGRFEIRDGDPAEIDLQIDDCGCNHEGKTSKAIFRWDEGSIFLDGAIPDEARPVKFGTQAVQQLRLVRAGDP